MYRFKRILVGLELQHSDQFTIEYAAKITRMAKSEKIYFLHVTGNLDIPEEIQRKYPDLLEPKDEADKDIMKQLVAKYFIRGYPETELVFNVDEGNPVPELLRRAKQKLIDLVILGKKHDPLSTQITEKIVRKAPCSVMIVPKGSKALIEKVLVPVDFSEYSEDAMDKAIAFASIASRKPPIQSLHVYSVPWSYAKTGKSYEEFSIIMLDYARSGYDEFIKKFDFKNVSASPLFELSDNVPQTIKDVVEFQSSDLLVMGVRGKTTAAAILMGSTTQKLLYTIRIPMIVVKRKGSGMGLLEALLQT